MCNLYRLSKTATYSDEVKKSRFDVIAFYVEDMGSVQQLLAENFDQTASHQCWAAKIGQQQRINDAGEPSGTAAKPILQAINAQQLDFILVIVNRWFGGVKLGTGGLARAYGGAAASCLKQAEKQPLIFTRAGKFYCQYSDLSIFCYYLTQQNISFDVEHLADGVLLNCQIEQDKIAALQTKVLDISRGQQQLILNYEDE